MTLTATLTRRRSTVDGTFGRFVAVRPDVPAFECHSLELPWFDNTRNISCIPAGCYVVVPYASSRFGMRYLISDVPDRGGILIHPGNLAGDESMGLKSDVEGCVLLGMAVGVIGMQAAVVNSRVAVDRVEKYFGMEKFQLDVRWEDGH